jgi:hypothetical protein
VMSSASDEELLARQSALQEEAGEVLAGLGLAVLVADIGPLLPHRRDQAHPNLSARHARGCQLV